MDGGAGFGEVSKEVGHHQWTYNGCCADHAGKGPLQLTLLCGRHMARKDGLQCWSCNAPVILRLHYKVNAIRSLQLVLYQIDYYSDCQRTVY